MLENGAESAYLGAVLLVNTSERCFERSTEWIDRKSFASQTWTVKICLKKTEQAGEITDQCKKSGINYSPVQ